MRSEDSKFGTGFASDVLPIETNGTFDLLGSETMEPGKPLYVLLTGKSD
jgi:hypothetical protein